MSPVNAQILLPKDDASRRLVQALQYRWVQVTGRVEFQQRAGRFLSGLRVEPGAEQRLGDLVAEVPPDPNPYLY